MLVVASYAAPVLMLDMDGASVELVQEIRDQAAIDGLTPAEADSAAAAGLEAAREQVFALPGAMILERAIVVMLSAVAAFAVYRAFGSKDSFMLHIRTAVVAQAAFALLWALLMALETFFAQTAVLARPELLLGDPGTQPGRLFVFSWLLLSGCNPPAIAAVILWGLGMAETTGRCRSNGLSTAAGIYLSSLILFAMPVFLQN